MAPGVSKQIGSAVFENYGSHHNNYPCAYLTAAASIGLNKDDVNTFARRLDRVFRKLIKRNVKRCSIEKIVNEKLHEVDITRDDVKSSDFSSQEDDPLDSLQNRISLLSAKNSMDNLLVDSKSSETVSTNDSNSDVGGTDARVEKGTEPCESGKVLAATGVTNQTDNPTNVNITPPHASGTV